jgi:hypothetical protein
MNFSTDTPLFSCQCSKGKEREVICDVMAKYHPTDYPPFIIRTRQKFRVLDICF